MPLLKEDYRKQEKIDGIFYDMSTPHYQHGIVSGNICCLIKAGLKNTSFLTFMRNLEFRYHPKENDDYVIPDVMLVCDRKHLKGGSYSGVPRLIVETLSPSTAFRDKTTKKDIYEKAGVEEYWIVSPKGESMEIYYLQDDAYVLTHSYILQDDPEENDYNADTVIALRSFPEIRMKLYELFEGVNV